jgi:hypothetical protein
MSWRSRLFGPKSRESIPAAVMQFLRQPKIKRQADAAVKVAPNLFVCSATIARIAPIVDR